MRTLYLLLISLILASCGDGGSIGPPAAPTLSLAYGLKQLKFSWNAVAGASYYKLSENPDGLSGYTQIGSNLTTTSYDHNITLYKRLNASYLLEACNDAGCTPSSPVYLSSNLVQAIGYMKASNTDASDSLGASLTFSADGNTLAIGAFDEASNATGINGNQDDNSDPGAGAVYIFTRDQGTWSQQAYVKASNTDAGDWFGFALALSADGNTLAVGAYGEDSKASGIDGNQTDNSAMNAGAVYIFTRTNGDWSQQAYVKASNTDAIYHNDRFGYALAISDDGNTLAVGAIGESSAATGINGDQADNSALSAGAVYLYDRINGKWSQEAYVKASNTTGGAYFGSALAIAANGEILAVGAPYIDEVYIYSNTNGVWSQQASLMPSNLHSSGAFGSALAFASDGNTLAVGDYGDASNATGIDGNQDDNSAPNAGAAYVFTANNGTWSQQAYLKASNTDASDYFGFAVAITADGNTLAVGAPYESSNSIGLDGDQNTNSAGHSGAVYVYTRADGAWSQQAYVKASNTDTSDQFGVTLTLTSDGTSLAVGADSEASNATGVGGNQTDNSATGSGAVYLY